MLTLVGEFNLLNKSSAIDQICKVPEKKKICFHTNKSNIFKHVSKVKKKKSKKKRNQQPQEQHKTSFVAGREKNTTVLKKAIGRKWKNLRGEWECERNVNCIFPPPCMSAHCLQARAELLGEFYYLGTLLFRSVMHVKATDSSVFSFWTLKLKNPNIPNDYQI